MALLLKIDYSQVNTILITVLLTVIVIVGLRVFKIWKPKKEVNSYQNVLAKVRSIEFAPNAIISIDLSGSVISWNRGAEMLFGWRESEMIGKDLTSIMPERYRKPHQRGIYRMQQGGDTKLIGRTVEVNGLTKFGREFPAELTLWKWNENGNIYFTGIIRNVESEKAEQKKVNDLLDLFSIGEEIDKTGLWKWDVINDVVNTSPGFNKIFDVTEEEAESNYFLRRVYYEDRPVVQQAITKAFTDKQGYEIEYRIVAMDGQLIWIHCIAVTKCDNDGGLTHIYGIIHNINDQKHDSRPTV